AFFFLLIPTTPCPTLFPYTTLFRSLPIAGGRRGGQDRRQWPRRDVQEQARLPRDSRPVDRQDAPRKLRRGDHPWWLLPRPHAPQAGHGRLRAGDGPRRQAGGGDPPR